MANKVLDAVGLATLWTKIKDLVNTKSKVSVTRNLTSGTKVADLTIDGTTTEIYAPSGSSITPADYVVETSSNSYWRWVKWNSGRVELWGWFSQSVTSYVTNCFVIGSASVTPYPFTISEPRTVASGQRVSTSGGYVDYDYGRTDYWSGIIHQSNTITANPTGTTQTCTWTCYVNARWK